MSGFSVGRALRLIAAALVLPMLMGCKGEPTSRENSLLPEQFTEEKFNSVTAGDDWNGVMKILGMPRGYFEIGQGRRRYTYSQPKDKAYMYMIYDVVVGPDGKVVDKSMFSAYQE